MATGNEVVAMAGDHAGFKQSFVARLRAASSAIKPSDPWTDPLRTVKGQLGSDGIARIATEAVFDALDLPPLQRTPESGKRIKKIMLKLGWTPVRSRHVIGRGRASRVRGYARLGRLAARSFP